MTPSVIDAVLFCAGRGSRLRPLTDQVAKPALPVGGVPLAAWGLAALRSAGLRVTINLSHLPETVTTALAQAGFSGWDAHLEQPEAFGTAGTLAALVHDLTPTVVTYNGDLISDIAVQDVLATHERSGASATLAVAPCSKGADLEVDQGWAETFIDRRVRPDAAGHRFLGVAVFAAEVIATLPSSRPLGLGETLLPDLVSSRAMAVHLHESYAVDVGTLERYVQANLDVELGFAPPPPVRFSQSS